MTKNTHLIGNKGENLAAKFLEERGLKIIERNFRTRFGEIDIICKDRNIIVFVEVKAKNTCNFGKPFEMVTQKKQHKLIRTAQNYLTEKGINLEKNDWRIDIISIQKGENTILWLKNAVNDDNLF